MPSEQDKDHGDLDQSYRRLQKISHQMVVLRNISKALSDHRSSLDDAMTLFIHMALEGFHNPDSISCRVKILDSVYETDDFSRALSTIRKKVAPHDIDDVFIELGFMDIKEKQILSDDEEAFFSTITLDLQAHLERVWLLETQRRQTKELELFASLMRHDLKNDIGLILTNIDLIKIILSDDSTELHEFVVTAEAICDRMINLLSVLGKGSTTPETEITRIINESVERAKKIYPELNIIRNIERLEGVEIPFNRLLPLVFDNLFRNAATYAGSKAMIEIIGKIESNQVRIEIQDDGPGISSSVRDRIFERGVSTTGGGYGLYLCREVLRIVDGSIELKESMKGKGAGFVISLPVRKIV
ncbi:MAG: sensor histidine kinase [Candidatus Thorarchaeota archaeon]